MMKLLYWQLLLPIVWCFLPNAIVPDYIEAQDNLSQTENSWSSGPTASSSSDNHEAAVREPSYKDVSNFNQNLCESISFMNRMSFQIPIRNPPNMEATSWNRANLSGARSSSDSSSSSTENSSVEERRQRHYATPLKMARRSITKKVKRKEKWQRKARGAKEKEARKNKNTRKAKRKEASNKSKEDVPETDDKAASVVASISAFSRTMSSLKEFELADRQLAFNMLLFFILFILLLRPVKIHHHHYYHQDFISFQDAQQ